MKRRYLYVLLFCTPALLISIIISFIAIGATAGVLWLFIFGDNPWPLVGEKMLTSVFFVVFLTLWVAFLFVAFTIGKKQEEYASLNVKPVVASIGTTVVAVLIAVLHQWGVGNIGTKSEAVLCSEFCQERKFSGSGTPPRDAGTPTCSCYDAKGRETVKVPIADVTAPRGK